MGPDSWETGKLAISALPTNMQNCLQSDQQYGPDKLKTRNWKVYPKVTESQKIQSQGQMQPFPR